jgi:hypothetical protein
MYRVSPVSAVMRVTAHLDRLDLAETESAVGRPRHNEGGVWSSNIEVQCWVLPIDHNSFIVPRRADLRITREGVYQPGKLCGRAVIVRKGGFYSVIGPGMVSRSLQRCITTWS